jgi:hypothetical protein
MVRELTTKPDLGVQSGEARSKDRSLRQLLQRSRFHVGAAAGCDLFEFLTFSTALARCFALKRPF